MYNFCINFLGSIKATVLIETILAAFEMDEILYELREHSAGLNGITKSTNVSRMSLIIFITQPAVGITFSHALKSFKIEKILS